MAVRLKDVAAHAGVSVKTVSNVVRGYPFVSVATRVRVQSSLDALGYRPNINARSLRTGRTGLIGLAVPRLHEPYFAEIAHAVVAAASRQGWTVLVEETGGDRDRELQVLSGLRPSFVDGILFSPLALTSEDLTEETPQTPIVLLGEHLTSGAADHVAIDNVAAARTATAHLISIGRHRIAAIGAQSGRGTETAQLRLRGFEEALREAGRVIEPETVRRVAHFGRDDGAAAAWELMTLPDPPDAIFCFNDLLALGALHALHAAGAKIPEDVAVIGFDDVEEARFATPGLTSIAPDKTRIADAAVAALARRIDADGPPAPQEIQVPHRLVVRGSTVRESADRHGRGARPAPGEGSVCR